MLSETELSEHAEQRQSSGRVRIVLGQKLQKALDKSYAARYLRLCRQLYITYPYIRKSLISKFGPLGKGESSISELPVLPKKVEMQRFIEEQVRCAGS
jgi:hypothetical protein